MSKAQARKTIKRKIKEAGHKPSHFEKKEIDKAVNALLETTRAANALLATKVGKSIMGRAKRAR